uniref:Uncharacterized protein n=1 Tax=Trypanosoma congolense (strain IL3000) TaxID=1068625 RepID=G0UME3_TRYCI|nr:hypothetical protein, unlikely [Trypanosoma congolense IL3000]
MEASAANATVVCRVCGGATGVFLAAFSSTSSPISTHFLVMRPDRKDKPIPCLNEMSAVALFSREDGKRMTTPPDTGRIYHAGCSTLHLLNRCPFEWRQFSKSPYHLLA